MNPFSNASPTPGDATHLLVLRVRMEDAEKVVRSAVEASSDEAAIEFARIALTRHLEILGEAALAVQLSIEVWRELGSAAKSPFTGERKQLIASWESSNDPRLMLATARRAATRPGS